MNNKERKLSVIIPTYNVEDLVGQAIDSVKWADEIFVVDSFSTDKTVEIAKAKGARVVQHEYVYSAKQKNWAIPQAKNEWILLLDSDEVVTSKLKKTVLGLLKSDEIEKYDGFGIARKHFFLGKFLRWGGRYPLYNIRLFRKNCRYEDRDVHAHIILPKDKIKNIHGSKGDMLHYSDRNLSQFFEKFNRYTTWQANYMLKFHQNKDKSEINWKEALVNPFYSKALIKNYWQFLPLVSVWRFVYMYVIRAGFLDGRYGFLIAVLYAFQDYVSKTKYLEMIRKNPNNRLKFQKFIMDRIVMTREAKNDKDFSQYFGSNLSITL